MNLVPALLLMLATSTPAPPPLTTQTHALECIGTGRYDELKPAVQASLSAARRRLLAKLTAPDTAITTLAAAFGELGQRYHTQLLFAPAEAWYRHSQTLAPDQTQAPYYLGYLFQQQSQLEPAASNYAHVLELQPDHPWATLRLAAIRLEQGRPEIAHVLLAPYRDHPELGAWTQFQLGRLALAQGDYPVAIDHLQRALERAPRADRIHYPLAMAWRGLGDRQRARAELAQRGNQEPPFPDPLIAALDDLSVGQTQLYTRAMDQIRRQAYTEAVASFHEALRQDSRGSQQDQDNPDAHTSLARALFLAGDEPAARAELEAVVATDPRALTLFLLGVLDERAGHFDAATARYRQTLERDPDHGGAEYLLARRLTATGHYAEATKHFRRAHQLVPDNTPARLWEVLTRAQIGATEHELAQALQSARRDFPEDPGFSYYLARLLSQAHDAKLRDPATALELARQLQAEHPDLVHRELIAIAQAAGGDYPAATQSLRQAIAEAQRLGWDSHELKARLAAYQQQRPLDQTPLTLPPLTPIDATRIFRDYPSATPH